MEEKIVELLGAGVPQVVVASTVGCDPSYVSQLLAREDIAARVSELRLKKAADKAEHDSGIDELEKEALSKLKKLLPLQTDAMKVTKIFQVLNSAKRAADAVAANAAATPATVVSLQIPVEVQVALKLTADRQVVEVDGRSMVPMPSHMVAAKLREKKAVALLENTQMQPRLSGISERTRSIVDQL